MHGHFINESEEEQLPPLIPVVFEGTSAPRPPLPDSRPSASGALFKLQHLLPVPHSLPLYQTLSQQSIIAVPENVVALCPYVISPTLGTCPLPAGLLFPEEAEEWPVLAGASQTTPVLSLWC